MENNFNLEFNEYKDSKLPAMIMLKNMGYEYLSPEEVNRLRNNDQSKVILESILENWIRENNKYSDGKQEYEFSKNNIKNAINKIRDYTNKGLFQTNKDIYASLMTGESHTEDIGDFNIKYIDWEHPENNVYHFTEEFSVRRIGMEGKIVPDMVIFVNGIPFVIIECKHSGIQNSLNQGIEQMIRNQFSEYAPHLFYYAQILVVLAMNQAKYATVGSQKEFWTIWREKDEQILKEVKKISKKNSDSNFKNQLINALEPKYKNYMKDFILNYTPKIPNAQSYLLYSLCNKKRLLKLIRHYILFDGREKKIARYQQFYCVEKTMKRIEKRQEKGTRLGGVVWHTQGSGKSLTMVMLAKSIAANKNIKNHKIVLVTDRVNLDKQLKDTFVDCGEEPIKAQSGKHLAKLLEGRSDKIITTVIDKFENASKNIKNPIHNPNVFVLVDEGHRTQYGIIHAKMKKSLPNACYIAFTGTPVMKKDKNTIEKFGGLIDTYTIDQAVEDKNVVPLLYEGRFVPAKIDKEQIDLWFENQTKNLNKKQKEELKRRFASVECIESADQIIKMIAYDISKHYEKNWKGTGFKAQLVTSSKKNALKYKYYLDAFNIVSSEVLISSPDRREGYSDINEEPTEIIKFWEKMMKKYGTEKQYNDIIIDSFKNDEKPEIIIVVDKLLTGFDAPVNTVLYLTRKLKDHTLLQAIARVNRVKEGKDFGYIIDYSGISENLEKALDFYRALPEFDENDLKGIFTFIDDTIKDLREKYDNLNDIFKSIKNKNDIEEYERLLADEELRYRFYEKLLNYSKVLSSALSNHKFYDKVENEKIEEYKNALKFYSKLRISVRKRYSDTIDFGEYENKIRKLINEYVGAKEVEPLTKLVNIFDQKAFNEEINKLKSDVARADMIATRTQKAINEHYDEDPVYYKKFSEVLENIIKAYREKRLSDAEYLNKVKEVNLNVVNNRDDDIPEKLKNYNEEKAYYRIIKKALEKIKDSNQFDEIKLAIDIGKIIKKYVKVNWQYDNDVINKMDIDIFDKIYDEVNKEKKVLENQLIDEIVKSIIDVAKVRIE